MEAQNPSETSNTIGVLIGQEIGEWAGFSSGRLIIKKDDGRRMEFRYGKESNGVIPKIGSLISIEHNMAMLPDVLKIELINEPKSTFNKDVSETYKFSLFLEKPTSLVAFVFAEIIIGVVLVLMGLSAGQAAPMAPVIFGLCGIPHFIIGYVLWYYGGQ